MYESLKSQCNIDWDGVDVILKITHLPSGISVSPNAKDVGQRDQIFDQLTQLVQANDQK